MKLSAVIITKNEEDKIANCIQSLQFCDEIIVIDDNSIDQTREIAKQLGAKVYSHQLNNDFAAQRNYGLKKAEYDWVLFVDADEIVPPQLSEEIKAKINNSQFSAYFLRRRDVWMGKPLLYGEAGNTCLIRLGKKDAGKWVRSVHEHWLINGNVGKTSKFLMHYPHPSIAEFIKHIAYYSRLHAKDNKKEGKNATIFHIIFFPVAKFLFFYLVKFGFLDGIRGFIVAVLMSLHSFVSWSILWLDTHKKYKFI